jgi:heat shock protein HtpX
MSLAAQKAQNTLRTFVLLGGLTALLLVIGQLVGGRSGLIFFAAISVVLNLAMYWFSGPMALRMNKAVELDESEAPELHRMVAQIAVRAGIPKPKVYMTPAEQPNAFATGRNPAHGVVAVTRGILDLLPPRELRGVLAHEIAHIRNRDILVATVAACIAGAIGYAAHALGFLGLGARQSEDDEHASPLAGLAMMLVAPIAATLVQLGISRSREHLADETGAAISGDPLALASALAKLERAAEILPADRQPATASLFIVNPLTGGSSLQRLFSTHPPMTDRIERLTLMARGGLRHAA